MSQHHEPSEGTYRHRNARQQRYDSVPQTLPKQRGRKRRVGREAIPPDAQDGHH